MKKFIAWFLVLALTAAVSIGATLAYLTDTDEDVNVMTIGKVKIDQLEYERVSTETTDEDATVQEFHDNKPLYPGVYENGYDFGTDDNYVNWDQIDKDGYTSGIWNPDEINNEVDKMVFVKNKGNYDAYVRTVFAFEAGNYANLDDYLAAVHLNINEEDWTWSWVETAVQIPNGNGSETTKYFIAVATYNEVLAPGAITEISLSQIALDKTATNEDVEAFGDTYQVLVKSQAIQADGFEDAPTALNEGFGAITAANVPFENDNPTIGTTVYNALHYLNGDATGTQITDKVTKVITGLNRNYAEVVNHYDGTLVDVEQDVPVYAYYVPNGSNNYDVYLLADDVIYAPKVSNGLFRNMKALQILDTGNFDFSRTETMRNMLRECQELQSVDTSAWDTSNVNDMGFMFQNCYKLKEIIGMNNWDTSNVTFMKQIFYNCKALEKLDLSGWETGKVTDMEMTFAFCSTLKEISCANWDVSNVTNMVGTFGQCFALEKVDTTGWKPLKVTSTKNMFYNCYQLTEIIGSGDWVMPANTSLYSMFQSCSSLKYLDATNWDLSNVENMRSVFWSCKALEEIEGTEKWNTGKVTEMTSAFEYCNSLKDLDVSTWDTSSVTALHGTFYDCISLEELDVSKWDTGNVTTMRGTFSCEAQNDGSMKFKELAVEDWDVSKVTNMNSMFYGCGQLTELDLSKWNVSNVTIFRHMFTDCFNLEKINFAGWDTGSATNFDGMFNDCVSLKKLDLSDFDTGNATTFHQFFEGCAGLTTVIGMENWDTSKVNDVSEMFNSNGKDMHLEYVDLSAFDTSSLTATYSMFNGCYRLKTVYVGDGWDMSKVTSSGAMFNGCSSLVGGNGSTVAQLGTTDVTYACVDTEETPGYLTHINDQTVTKP
jgi:predicted ribosomally synthesized peptide with SipW-like signal peptide